MATEPQPAQSIARTTLENAMLAVAIRWAERDGLDPTAVLIEPRRSRTLASMREDELDLDIAAALAVVLHARRDDFQCRCTGYHPASLGRCTACGGRLT